jgi:hypothetical protein
MTQRCNIEKCLKNDHAKMWYQSNNDETQIIIKMYGRCRTARKCQQRHHCLVYLGTPHD